MILITSVITDTISATDIPNILMADTTKIMATTPVHHFRHLHVYRSVTLIPKLHLNPNIFMDMEEASTDLTTILAFIYLILPTSIILCHTGRYIHNYFFKSLINSDFELCNIIMSIAISVTTLVYHFSYLYAKLSVAALKSSAYNK